VIHACTNQQLSLLAVNQSSLAEELNRLKTNLDIFNFDLIFDIKDISSYDHLQLAKCTFVRKNKNLYLYHLSKEISIILTVLIRRKQVYYLLLEGFTVPFLAVTPTGPQLCSIRFDHDLLVLRNGHPIPITNSQTSTCSIVKGICYLDEYGSVPSTSVDCVKTLLQDATVKEVLNSCSFTCRPANSEEPTVNSIGNGTRNLFALTNIDIYTVVECNYPNNTLAARHLVYNDTHVARTYFVHLTSCLCSIVFTNRPPVYPLRPCRQEDINQLSPVIRLVIPIRWSQINDSMIIKAVTVEGEIIPEEGYENLSSVYRPDWRLVDSVLEQPKPLKFEKFENFVTHTGNHGDTYFSYGAVIWATLLTMALFHVYCKVLGITSRAPLAFPAVQYTANALSDCDAKLEHRLHIFFISISVMNVAFLFALFVTLFICLRKRQARRAAKGACVGYSLRCVRAETTDHGRISSISCFPTDSFSYNGRRYSYSSSTA
jgi:hypothetical protein